MKYKNLICDNCGKQYDSNQCGKYHHFCCIECRRESGKLVVTDACRRASKDNITKANKTLFNQGVYLEKSIATKRANRPAKPSSYLKDHQRHEHRTIVEKMIGRKLTSNEIVHHIDGNKHNNSPDNLLLLTRSEHIKLHIAQGDMKRKKVVK